MYVQEKSKLKIGTDVLTAGIKHYFNTRCKDENLNNSLFASYNLGCLNRVEQSSSPFTSLGIPSLSCSTASPYWPQGNSCSMGLHRRLWSTLHQQVWLVVPSQDVARAEGPQECCLVFMQTYHASSIRKYFAQLCVSIFLQFVPACVDLSFFLCCLCHLCLSVSS